MKTLKLRVEQDTDGTYIVSRKHVLAHGTGKTLPDALRDYADVLDTLYACVRDGADAGSAQDKAELAQMEADGIRESEQAQTDTLVHLAAEAVNAAYLYREAAREYYAESSYEQPLNAALKALHDALYALEHAE